MEFKDYYATLGLKPSATEAEIKRAYRKLARKYHPDVSKEANAEAQFKEVGEAYKALNDTERRAAYDDIRARRERGQDYGPQGGGPGGYEFRGRGSDAADAAEFSDFFESLFGRGRGAAQAHAHARASGEDHHARVVIDIADAYRGARRTLSLRMPVANAKGQVSFEERELDVAIPKGVRQGQHLRLSGQGSPGFGDGPAGDLYLEIAFAPDARFRLDDRDVYVTVPIAPWEAALGANIDVRTPDTDVQLTVPPGSATGRKLRLRGKGLPSTPPGDLYVVLSIVTPAADTPAAKEAYAAFAHALSTFNPRNEQETST
jgi:curved DNA-binding protein